MKLSNPIAELRCPECRCALSIVSDTQERIVFSHPNVRELLGMRACPHAAKLFAVAPPMIEAVEL